MSLNLFNMADREFLAACYDAADDDGWFTSEGVHAHLNSNKISRASVAIRISWFVRSPRNGGFGLMDRDASDSARFRLNRQGHAVVTGVLPPEVAAVLDDLDEGARITVARTLARGFGSRRTAERTASRVAYREFQRARGK